ncbi:YbjN domain-containing protein [Coleofasciculus sp. E1-EBD-02]|uniref:YbjN domain-containing protein n=1 Tax=Coleofasciculus sp. E1-EBD-02 TaxID=3068481 RepID=UPI0033052BF7
MSPLIDEVIHFFYRDQWHFAKNEDESVVRVAFGGHNGRWGCYAQIREAEQQIIFYSVYPEVIPKKKRKQIAVLLTLINYDLVIGNFELNLDGGHLRYKTSIDVEGTTLNWALIKQLVYNNVFIMDKYYPAIEAVLKEEASPEEAVNRIENVKSDDTV